MIVLADNPYVTIVLGVLVLGMGVLMVGYFVKVMWEWLTEGSDDPYNY